MKFLKYFVIILLVLIVVFFGAGILFPTVEYEREIVIDKPVTEVWNVMSDEAKASDWISGYKRGELVEGEANTVGAVSHIYVEDQGQETMMKETITAIEPNELFAMKFTMDFMDMDYTVHLEPQGDKTLLRTVSKTEGNGIFAKSMIAFMPGMMKKQEEKNLNQLKQVAESNTKEY